MRIQHNIMAMNAYRNYNTNTSALSKNLEKLSSGYRSTAPATAPPVWPSPRRCAPDHRPDHGQEERQGRHLHGADR